VKMEAARTNCRRWMFTTLNIAMNCPTSTIGITTFIQHRPNRIYAQAIPILEVATLVRAIRVDRFSFMTLTLTNTNKWESHRGEMDVHAPILPGSTLELAQPMIGSYPQSVKYPSFRPPKNAVLFANGKIVKPQRTVPPRKNLVQHPPVTPQTDHLAVLLPDLQRCHQRVHP